MDIIKFQFLDGGLIKWCKEKKEVESGKSKKYSKTNFKVNKNHSLLKTYKDIKKIFLIILFKFWMREIKVGLKA